MVKVFLHRQLSLVNDRGLLFLEIDHVKKGKVTVGKVLTYDLVSGNHGIQVTDIIGFSSPTYHIKSDYKDDIHLIVRNNLLVISLFLLMILATILLVLSHDSILIVTIWLIFINVIVLYQRQRLYLIEEK